MTAEKNQRPSTPQEESLSAFFRDLRAKVDPAQYGFPRRERGSGSGRHIDGISQGELAGLIHTSPWRMGQLERNQTPMTDGDITALVETLELSHREEAQLWMFAKRIPSADRPDAVRELVAVAMNPDLAPRSGPGLSSGPMTKPKPQVDTSRAHSARVYDWLLGGKDHYPVDVEVAKSLWPGAAAQARANRAFMHRAAAWLAGQGIDQFLDIGTGIPTEPNLHQIVQKINPAARIVYADNDPIVLRHAEALLISTPEGGTDYIEADVREANVILDHARTFLDFSRPVALSMIGLLHFLPDHEDPYGIVRTLADALAPGSHVVLSQGASDMTPAEMLKEGAATYQSGGIQLAARTRDEFGRFFDGLELVDPGIVVAPEWARGTAVVPVKDIYLYAGVARVP